LAERQNRGSRGDSHYCSEPVLALLESLDCQYILGLATNSILAEKAAPWKQDCAYKRKLSRPTVRRFHQFQYAAKKWSAERRVIARVEATALGEDVRYITTNLPGRGKVLYEKVYCARRAPHAKHDAAWRT
jgi:Transposase DDE domain group 1